MTNKKGKLPLNPDAFVGTSQWDLIVEYIDTENFLRHRRIPRLPAEEAMYNDNLFKTIFGGTPDEAQS